MSYERAMDPNDDPERRRARGKGFSESVRPVPRDLDVPERSKLVTLLDRFSTWAALQDRQTQREVRKHVNKMLDDLKSMDLFGTEGQSDPRGDRRK